MPDNFIEIHRALIISLAARNNIPAVYQTPVIARDGGLLSYGADFRDIFHRAARYVDQIFGGAKPSELPVQLPTKVFDGHQSDDCKGARPHRTAHASSHRRRGD
jgi:putative ABC transport system substrate-binding protein